MKRYMFIVAISLLLGGCGQSQNKEAELTSDDVNESLDINETEETTEDKYPPNPDPEPLGEGVYVGKIEMQGIGNEEKYDNIRIEMEETTYKLGTEKIMCNITNENVGKGFWVYYVPLLEYKDNGEWKRLRYYTKSMKLCLETPKWYYVANKTAGMEGFDTTKQHSTMSILFTKYVMDELVPGEYRLVLFVGPNKYYAEFTLEE